MNQNNNQKHANIILIVDDNPADALLMKEAFALCQSNNEINVVEDGIYALEFLREKQSSQQSVCPDIILLDLNMPRRNGMEVLRELKVDPEFSVIPVIIFTSSASREDIKAAYAQHANAYLQKPGDFDGYIKIAKSIEDFWFSAALLNKA
ncbi:MAG: response regulator [Nitrosomonas sp.]|nr:MAG: response regulator [Nitrosomonas sp.]